MTLQENVSRLVRYCGQHQAHGYMVDERNKDRDFNIVLPEERSIREKIENLRIILFTGEAGDGKSRILKNIEGLLTEHGFSRPCNDFSALTEADKKKLIERLRKVLEGTAREKLVISANVGVFMQAVLHYDITLIEELTKERADVQLCNFESRNLAEDAGVFSEIVKNFVGGRTKEAPAACTETSCPCYANCAFRINREKILTDSGIEAMRTICNAIYLTGGHITFRELLSLLAFTVTFGHDCEDRKRYAANGGDMEKVLYYNIFHKNNDILLSKVSRMDPALKRGRLTSPIGTKKEYRQYMRKHFFEEALDLHERFSMLNVDYLVKFFEVLEYMNRPPFHYDTMQDNHPVLQDLKKGINKMSSQGRSDSGLVVTDTPLILGNKIRTEFKILQDMNMIWHRYDVHIGKNNHESSRLWNQFYLSYMVKKGEERKLISLLIDYRQFRYLMMCSEDYFLNRTELTVEEYAVNTFYRKILQETEQAYDSIIVRFEDKKEELCDFSLTVHESEDFFSDKKTRTILIKRED